MPDLATLELRVRFTDVDQATESMNRLGQAGTKVAGYYNNVTSTVTTDMNKMATQVSQAGEEGGVGLGRIEHALASIAIAESGLNPHLGHLTTALGAFSLGATLMIGILAGLAAVAFWFDKITESAKANDAALKALHETTKGLTSADLELQQAMARMQINAATSQIQAAQTRLADLQAQIAKARTMDILGSFGMVSDIGLKNIQLLTHDIQAAEHDRVLLKNELTRLTGEEAARTSDLARNAKQEYEIAQLNTSEQEHKRILFEEQNKLVDAQRNFTGDMLAKTEAAVKEEAKWKLATLETKQALAAKLEIMKAASTQADQLEGSLISSLDRGLTRALGKMGSLFSSVTGELLDIWRRKFIEPAMAALTGLDLQRLRMEQEFPGEGALRSPGAGGVAAGAGVVGLLALGTVINQFAQMAALTKQIATDFKALANALQDVRDQVAGDALQTELNQVARQFDALRDQAKALLDEQLKRYNALLGDPRIQQSKDAYQATLAEIARLEAARIQQLKDEAGAAATAAAAEKALTTARLMQDLDVRMLAAQGRQQEADDLAFQRQQEREYQDAVVAKMDDVYLARLREVQQQEYMRRELDKLIVARQAEIDAAKTALAQTTQTVTMLRDFAAQLRGTTGTPVQNLAAARAEFERMAALAQGGDQGAAAKLPQLAQTLLDLSRQYNASGMGYQQDLAEVLKVIDSLGDQYDVQRNLEQMQLDTMQAMLDQLKLFNGTWVDFLRLTGTFIQQPIYTSPGTAPAQTSDGIVQATVASGSGIIAKLDELAATIEAGNLRVARALEGANL